MVPVLQWWLNVPAFQETKRIAGATFPKASEWSVGAAYDARESKVRAYACQLMIREGYAPPHMR